MSGYLWHGKPDLERINARIMADRTQPHRQDREGHGTEARYVRHRREGDRPCEACLEANARAKVRRLAEARQRIADALAADRAS